LPSATFGKELTAKKRSAKAPLPSVFCRALGKAFAEHHGGLRQRKATVVTVMRRDAFFAESLQSSARQIAKHFFEILFAERLQDNARQRGNHFFLKISLPSASNNALGKEEKFVFFETIFA